MAIVCIRDSDALRGNIPGVRMVTSLVLQGLGFEDAVARARQNRLWKALDGAEDESETESENEPEDEPEDESGDDAEDDPESDDSNNE